MRQVGQRTDRVHIARKDQRCRQPVKQRRRDDTPKQFEHTDLRAVGEECLIDCSSTPMVYCDFATQKVTRISFEELQVNDKVIMCIRSSEMESFRSGSGENTIKVEQLQLYTQRAAE